MWPPGKVGTTQTLSQREQNAELRCSRYFHRCHIAEGGEILYFLLGKFPERPVGKKVRAKITLDCLVKIMEKVPKHN